MIRRALTRTFAWAFWRWADLVDAMLIRVVLCGLWLCRAAARLGSRPTFRRRDRLEGHPARVAGA